MKGLNCLLQNGKQIKLIGEAMRDMANTILFENQDAEITVPYLYKRLKKAGVGIDLESAAYIYADVFANDINQYKNFESEDKLLTYGKIGKEQAKLASLKEKAKESIKKLEKKISDNDLVIANKKGLTDPELDALRQKQKDLRIELEEKRKIAKTGRYSDSSRLSASEKSAYENIAELQEKLATNDLEIEKISRPTSVQLEQYREQQKELLKEIEQKRKDAGIGKYKVKKALIDAGYSKTTKDGNVILDWSKLMGKSEEDIKEEIKALGLGNEEDIFDALEGEWKTIIEKALTKARNDLARKNGDTSPINKNAVEKIADLHARGLFADFKDDYKNAINKIMGVSRETLGDLSELDKLAATARMLVDSPYGLNNLLGAQLQHDINKLISKARYRAKGNGAWFYKTILVVGNLFDMVNLALLNNLGNRPQNFASGYSERNSSAINYGYANKKISNLAKQTARDSILNGGVGVGDVSNMFFGNRDASEKVREWLTSWIPNQTAEKIANWSYGFLMGTAALNGIDNSMKIKNTWTRFISAMEQILVSEETAKGLNEKSAKKKIRENLNKQLFGENWEKARIKAEAVMRSIVNKGGVINITPESIERFTADIVKAQLVNNNIISQEQLDGAWNASYRSAGRAMGHVPNNFFTKRLNKNKEASAQEIEKELAKGEYGKAGMLMLTDLFLNKIFFRFAGGGTNWIVLKAEKGGLGLVSGLIGRVRDNKDFDNKKRLSELSADELEDSIYKIQRSNDKFARGSVGLMVNGLLLVIAKMAYEAYDGDSDEEKEKKRARKAKLLNWMDNNKWSNKYVNNLVPWFLTAYIAWQRQKRAKGGLAATGNMFRYSPLRAFAYNFANVQEQSNLDNLTMAMGGILKNDKEKNDEGYGKLGLLAGQIFNVDPIPFRPWKDAYTLFHGLKGDIKSGYVKPKSIWEGYLKFGITDWPKINPEASSGY